MRDPPVIPAESTNRTRKLHFSTVLTVSGLLVLAAVAALVGIVILRFEQYAGKPRASFEADLKKQVTPEELRSWAAGVLEASKSSGSYGVVTNNIHPALLRLSHFRPVVYTFAESGSEPEHVRVYYEAGHFGYWGVEIGITNQPMPASSSSERHVPWVSGMWFFYGSG